MTGRNLERNHIQKGTRPLLGEITIYLHLSKSKKKFFKNYPSTYYMQAVLSVPKGCSAGEYCQKKQKKLFYIKSLKRLGK